MVSREEHGLVHHSKAQAITKTESDDSRGLNKSLSPNSLTFITVIEALSFRHYLRHYSLETIKIQRYN